MLTEVSCLWPLTPPLKQLSLRDRGEGKATGSPHQTRKAPRMNGPELLRHLADGMMSGRTTDHAWDDVIGAWFDIAAALYWLDESAIPAAWGYRAGAVTGEWDYSLCEQSEAGCSAHGSSGDCYGPWSVLVAAGADLGDGTAQTFDGDPVGALVYAGTILGRYADLIDPDRR